MAKKVLEIKNLTKKYGKFIAVDQINFSVDQGEVFGLLGENGAGKTTTLEMIEGLRKPTSGEIQVLGLSINKDLSEIKEKIGVQLQSSAYYSHLKLYEILELFGSFYEKHVDIDELLRSVDLFEKKNSYVGKLSGGQQQRFSIIASLINDPDLVFLDEPTTGLDPVARRNLWEIIVKIKKQGKSIILTTHYMEEAEKLCDRIAIMDNGKILKNGPVNELIREVAYPYRVDFVSKKVTTEVREKLTSCCGEILNPAGKDNYFELNIKTKANLNKAINIIQKIHPDNLSIGEANLEDLFIELTGKDIREDKGGKNA